MGNQACALLPDGVAGKALKEMTGPSRIAITERFWFELLKVQFPGVREAGFFDRHYEQPDALDSLVRDAYFLQLVATNEHSGNFRTFLRFWARLLHYYRTSPRDAKPCGAATILSLSLLCRCLLKQFAETFSAPELIFQLEQAPCEPAPDAERRQPAPASVGNEDDSAGSLLLVTYRGRRLGIRVQALPQPTMGDASARPSNASANGADTCQAMAASACLEPFCAFFPEDAELLRNVSRCAFRCVATGDTFPAMDLLERVHDDPAVCEELVVCPCGVPNSSSSVLRSVFREVTDFLVSSSFGAVSGAVPSPLLDGEVEQQEENDFQGKIRNLSTAPHTMQLQAVLLEIVLSLSAVIAPRYGPPGTTSRTSVTASRADFCAPFVFASHEKILAAKAAAKRTAVAVSSTKGFPEPAGTSLLAEATPNNTATRTPASPASPSPAAATSAEEEADGPLYWVAHSPIPGECALLPFLTALLHVLEDGDEDASGTGGFEKLVPQPAASPASVTSALGDSGGTGGCFGDIPVRDAPSGSTARSENGSVSGTQQDCDGGRHIETVSSDAVGSSSQQILTSSGRVDGAGNDDRRAEALLATLLSCVWLQPHAAALPRPPQEVVRLLGGVTLPHVGRTGEAKRLQRPSLPEDDAAADVMPAAADEQAAAKAATSAARHLSIRALLVLLLLLFQAPEAHPAVGRAFANLADPLLGERGRRHNGAAAPLNFTQLLKAVMAQIREGLFPLLLYCLVQKNEGFRSYCLCRADADMVLVPILEVLHALPAAVEGRELAVPPPSATALLLTLLSLTGDRGFCEGASRARLADGTWVLRHARPIHNVTVSSLLIIVLLRVAHWNFASCKDPFFNRAVAGILGNLAKHCVEQLHWYAAARMIEVGHLLAKNMLKSLANDAEGESRTVADQQRRNGMIRELLRSLFWLISGCLRVPAVARNCGLVYTLQKHYPEAFVKLEMDTEMGPTLRHVRAVIDWFQAQCPPEGVVETNAVVVSGTGAASSESGSRVVADGSGSGDADHDTHIGLLEAAAPRLPGLVDALAHSAGGPVFAFSEVPGATSSYFLPVVWRASRKLLPDHVCWSQRRAESIVAADAQ